MYLNKVLLIGNLTREPEMRSLPSGAKVTSFSLATNRVWKDQNGQRQESTDYHNVVVFGRQAETSSQYLVKGAMAMIEGRLTTRSWDDKDGTKKYRTEVVADRVQFGPRSGGAPTAGSQTSGSASSGPGASEMPPSMDTIEYPDDEANPDDIPF
jgi:single-strand DNA-binding protein